MKLIKPPALRLGDTIGIVAPASNIKLDLLEQGCRELEALGFKTYMRPDIVSSYRYLAGARERRLGEFLEMLKSRDIHAIFCARGGYGSGHLIPDLEVDVIRENAKIISGASDITLLLNKVERAGVVAFHGPMVATTIRQGAEGYDRQFLLDLLTVGAELWGRSLTAHDVSIPDRGRSETAPTVPFPLQFPVQGTAALREGTGEGRLIGGCLSLVVSTLGTDHEIDTRDSILILEDVDAKPYQIDRMITHLKQAGKFQDVRGVVFGEMQNCMQHPDQGYTLQEVLLDLLSEFRFPILFGFPTGHTSRPNVIVPFGVRARIDLNTSTVFELLEPAVS